MKQSASRKDEILTSGRLESLLEIQFENLKDLVESSAKAAATGLREEMQDLGKGLKNDMQDLKYELKGDICKLEKRIEETESRLSEKIDAIGARIDDHEAKSAAIAHPAH